LAPFLPIAANEGRGFKKGGEMKRFSFLLVLGILFAFELFYWGDLSATSQELSANTATDAITALDQSGGDLTMSTVSAIDPTSMILLGSGLIGLAGIGRRKTKP
jgi:hypothetical protein